MYTFIVTQLFLNVASGDSSIKKKTRDRFVMHVQPLAMLSVTDCTCSHWWMTMQTQLTVFNE